MKKYLIGFIITLFAVTDLLALNIQDTASILPPETVLVFEIKDFNDVRKNFKKTTIHDLINDQSMKAVVEKAKTKWNEKLQEGEDEITRQIFDSKIYPEGRFVFAFTFQTNAISPNPVRPLLISDFGSKVGKVKELMKDVANDLVEEGSSVEDIEFQGINIKSIIHPADETGMLPESANKTNYCFIDGYLVTTPYIENIKLIIALIKGSDAASLSSTSSYKNCMTRLAHENSDINLYINISKFLSIQSSFDQTGTVKTMQTNLGLDNVDSFSATATIGTEEAANYKAKAFLKVNGPKKGIAKIFELSQQTISIPSIMTDNTASFSLLNLNIPQAFDQFAKTLTAFNPMLSAWIYSPVAPASPEGDPAIMLKEDIIDKLGEQLIVSQLIDAPVSKDTLPKFAIAVEHKDRKGLDQVFTELYARKSSMQNIPEVKQILGYNIFPLFYLANFNVPGAASPLGYSQMQNEPDVPEKARLNHVMTVTDTYLIFGNASTVEKIIRNISDPQNKNLNDLPWIRKAISKLPQQTGLLNMENTGITTELMWKLIKANYDQQNNNMATPIYPFNFGLEKLIEPSLLPEFEKVKKYFSVTTVVGNSGPEGFMFESKDIDVSE